MITMDVYICDNIEEAAEQSAQIVKSVGPDGTKAKFSLLEEFLGGDEFAVKIITTTTLSVVFRSLIFGSTTKS